MPSNLGRQEATVSLHSLHHTNTLPQTRHRHNCAAAFSYVLICPVTDLGSAAFRALSLSLVSALPCPVSRHIGNIAQHHRMIQLGLLARDTQAVYHRD